MKTLLRSLVLTLLAFSCATYTPPREYKIEKERIIDLTFDATWNRVIEWFATNGTPIKTLEDGSGLIATDYHLQVETYSQYCDCAQGGSGFFCVVINEPTGHFNIYVKKVTENTTRVMVTTGFSAVKRSVDEYGAARGSVGIDCSSTGLLEKKLLDYVSH